MEIVFIESMVYQALKASPGLNSLVGEKIYPITLPQKCPYPAVTFMRISSHPISDLDGYGLEKVHMRISVHAKELAQAKSAALEVRRAMAKAPFTAEYEGEVDLFADSTNTYMVCTDFWCWQKGGFNNG